MPGPRRGKNRKANANAKIAEPKSEEPKKKELKVLSITSRQYNTKKQHWEFWTNYSDGTSSAQPRESFVDEVDGEEVLNKVFDDYMEAFPFTGVFVYSRACSCFHENSLVADF
jgi:hypothetical protein